MKHEEILAAARREKSKGKEFENKTSLRSGIIGMLISLIVGGGLFIIEYCYKGSLNWGFLAIIFAGNSVDRLYEGIKTRKGWLIVWGVVLVLLAIITILAFVNQMVTA